MWKTDRYSIVYHRLGCAGDYKTERVSSPMHKKAWAGMGSCVTRGVKLTDPFPFQCVLGAAGP